MKIQVSQPLNYFFFKKSIGSLGYKSHIKMPDYCSNPSRIFLSDYDTIEPGAKFIMRMDKNSSRFIMKKHSGIARGFTVVTNNHSVLDNRVGSWFNDPNPDRIGDVDKDVIIEEDVWIAANVTILYGVTVGRGSIIGAGSVLRIDVPPYAIVSGNPAKVIGFKFTPYEVLEHEKSLYPENERLTLELLEKNYKKYFLDNIKEIKRFVSQKA